MDLGILATLLRAESFPPPDMWLSGDSLPYYYWGALLWTVPISISGLSLDVAYNLVVGLAGGLVGFLLQRVNLLRHLIALGLQDRSVDEHPALLHAREYRDQRHLDLVKKVPYTGFFQFGFKNTFQLQGDVGIFRRVGGGLGIMLDDVGAAVYAALSLQAILYIYEGML